MLVTISPHDIYQNARNRKIGCLFCDPVKGMVIHETRNFRVLVDTFPITPGHLMISTQAHYGSAGEIPEELMQELTELKEEVRYNVQSIGNSCIFYEHGRAGCCLSKPLEDQKCEHFHLHCLPVELCIKDAVCNKFQVLKMENYRQISPLFFEHGNYLYFENARGEMFFFPAEDNKVESHLLRTLICNTIGIPNRSDWQTYNEEFIFIQSYDLVKSFNFSEQGRCLYDLSR